MVLLIASFFLNTICANAQIFDGINSFAYDTVWLKELRKRNVSSVTETMTARGNTYFNGRCSFDRYGRLSEYCAPFGRGFNRTRMEYNDKGQLIRRTRYEQNDSARVAGWTSYTYDEAGRIVKETHGQLKDGQIVEIPGAITTMTVINGQPTRETRTPYGNHYSSEFRLDSVSGIYSYKITYQYRHRDSDKKGRSEGDKKLIRKYTVDRCSYEDIIDYDLLGRLETADKIKSYYNQYDEKGRLIETGEVLYEDEYMEFLRSHPEEYGLVISPKFMQAFYRGEISARKTPRRKYTYDETGRLVAYDGYGTHFVYTYNKKGQLTGQACSGNRNWWDELFYDKKGLIYRTVTFSGAKGSDTTNQQPQEAVYSYTFY